jgi:quinol monooxygenase YgiN
LLADAPSEAPIEAHRTSSLFAQLTERLAPLLAAPPDTRQHHGLTVAAATRIGLNGITAATHVDVVPQHKDEAVSALQRIAAGNTRYDVWQQVNRPNHFTVVEAWSSRRALNAHAAAAETKGFRVQLTAMTGALYDERLYRALR